MGINLTPNVLFKFNICSYQNLDSIKIYKKIFQIF